MKNIIYLLFTGAPGSGKGYLGECTINELKAQNKITETEAEIIATGDLIRAEVKSGSDLGKQIKAVMEAGQLVSDEIVERLLMKNLIESQAKLIIFDGYPRTVAQVDCMLRIAGNTSVIIIHRDTPTELILERVKKRRICSKCGKVQTNEHDNCIECHAPLAIRKDDAVIEQRLALYQQETLPALEMLRLCYGSSTYTVNGQQEATETAKMLIENQLANLFD